jgi:hypothetical protein
MALYVPLVMRLENLYTMRNAMRVVGVCVAALIVYLCGCSTNGAAPLPQNAAGAVGALNETFPTMTGAAGGGQP